MFRMVSIMALSIMPVPADMFVEPPPLYAGAYAYEQADRLDTPEPATFSEASANGRCIGAEPLLLQESPGWSVERMSRIMYRESRCKPWVRNRSGATGLLQVMPSNCSYLAQQMGEPCTVGKLQEPLFNIRAAVELWEYDGYRPWAL